MKHIINVLKNEIFNQNNEIANLIKKVTISQDSYLKNRNNEAMFNIWSDNVKQLQKVESNLRYLRSAYVTMCNACEVEPQTNDEIIAEKTARKPRQHKVKNTEPKAE